MRYCLAVLSVQVDLATYVLACLGAACRELLICAYDAGSTAPAFFSWLRGTEDLFSCSSGMI